MNRRNPAIMAPRMPEIVNGTERSVVMGGGASASPPPTCLRSPERLEEKPLAGRVAASHARATPRRAGDRSACEGSGGRALSPPGLRHASLPQAGPATGPRALLLGLPP